MTVFELLTATFAADDFNLRDDTWRVATAEARRGIEGKLERLRWGEHLS